MTLFHSGGADVPGFIAAPNFEDPTGGGGDREAPIISAPNVVSWSDNLSSPANITPINRISFEKTILKLRREGYGLIDLQRQDIAFTTVWYRKGKALFGRAGADVAMLLWEMQEPAASTTVLTWRF